MVLVNHKQSVVRRISGFRSEADGFDLTRPSKHDALPIHPRFVLSGNENRVIIDPKKTALVAIDLQDYFVSPALGRPTNSAVLKVVNPDTS
jgi:hypothetical protein